MTGARHFRMQRERERRTSIRTARAVPGASYMARLEARPHAWHGGDDQTVPRCRYCAAPFLPETPDNCPGPARSKPKNKEPNT